MNFEWDENKAATNQQKHGLFRKLQRYFRMKMRCRFSIPTIQRLKTVSSCWE